MMMGRFSARLLEQENDEPYGEYWSYAEDVGNHDRATILMQRAHMQ